MTEYYDYAQDLAITCAKEKRRKWNRKVITTGRQWVENDNGSDFCASSSLDSVKGAIMEGLGISRMEVSELLENIF